MTKDQVKEKLYSTCEAYGVNCDTVFLCSFARESTKDDIYRCRISLSKLKDSHRFVIKYFPSDNRFVAWNLYEGARKAENFQVSKRHFNFYENQLNHYRLKPVGSKCC